MFYIDKLTGCVSLNRGDDATFTLHINEGTNLCPIQYNLKEQDNIYFAIEEPNQPFEHAIVKKVINLKNSLLDKDGNITFDITSDDTVALMPGTYYYEIKMSLYKENEFKNSYITVSLDGNKYSIFDEEQQDILSNGTFTIDENLFTFEDYKDYTYIAIFQDNKLVFNNPESNASFANLTYKQQQNKVNTIIPQTQWIVER